MLVADEHCYANTAAVGQLRPEAAVAIGTALAQLQDVRFYEASYPGLQAALMTCRQRVAELLVQSFPGTVHTDLAADIALVSSTSDGIATFIEACCGDYPAGTVIAIGRHSFGSVLAALQPSLDRGVQVVEVGQPDGQVLPEHLIALCPASPVDY